MIFNRHVIAHITGWSWRYYAKRGSYGIVATNGNRHAGQFRKFSTPTDRGGGRIYGAQRGYQKDAAVNGGLGFLDLSGDLADLV